MAEQTMNYDLKYKADTKKAIDKINELSQKTQELTGKYEQKYSKHLKRPVLLLK